MNTHVEHKISIRCEPPRRGNGYSLMGGHRAHCACGWSSDCYSQMSDTERAIEVHLRRAHRKSFDDILARSSIGAAITDIKKRGIDAHLVDLERELNRRWRVKKPATAKTKTSAEDAAFVRGFGVAIASIWTCSHDRSLIKMLLKENGFTLKSFRDVAMLDGDYEAIKKAVRR